MDSEADDLRPSIYKGHQWQSTLVQLKQPHQLRHNELRLYVISIQLAQ